MSTEQYVFYLAGIAVGALCSDLPFRTQVVISAVAGFVIEGVLLILGTHVSG